MKKFNRMFIDSCVAMFLVLLVVMAVVYIAVNS